MKKMICIVCPVGCHLEIDKEEKVTGNRCPRGLAYALNELHDPRRTLTTTVRTTFSYTPRLSVKSRSPLPKDKLFEVMNYLNTILIDHPVEIGDVIVANILGTGIDMIATKEIK